MKREVTTKHGFRPIKYTLNDEFEINNFSFSVLSKTFWLSKYVISMKGIFRNGMKLLNQFPGNVESSLHTSTA